MLQHAHHSMQTENKTSYLTYYSMFMVYNNNASQSINAIVLKVTFWKVRGNWAIQYYFVCKIILIFIIVVT